MFRKSFFIVFLAVLFFASCQEEIREEKLPESEEVVTTPEPEPVPEPLPEKHKPKPISDVNPVQFDMSLLENSGSMKKAEAHASYLEDEMAFFELDSEFSGSTAVIVSKVAKFYPEARVDSNADLEALPEGIPLPFAAIIPIQKKLDNSSDQYYGFFEFEDNYNYFYQTEWEGVTGLVFGADLAGLNSKAEKNALISAMYSGGSRYEEAFPPYTGFYRLNEAERASLEENRLALQRVHKDEYYLSLQKPDDMIALYMNTARDKYTPLFISTDLVAQSLHLFFDKFLQYTEEEFFVPRLEKLVGSYIALLEEDVLPVGEEADEYDRAKRTLLSYFQVAQCLVRLAPEVHTVEQDWGPSTIEYVPRDEAAVLGDYPAAVQEEVRLILDASEFTISPNFEYREDYSQYKPRGHYTKNGILMAYFRTMMWFGRIHFYMTDGTDTVISFDGSDSAQGTGLEQSLEKLPMVAIMSGLTAENPELYDEWRQLFDPITDLIGMSDDLSYYESIPFFEGLNIEDIRAWTNDREQVMGAIVKAREELRAPVIAGNSLWEAPSGEKRTPPLGWRLFGQRFTWDSYVHQNVSPPRLMSRDIVRGLDIMKAFGSHTADALLANSDYPQMAGLEARLDSIEEEFNKKDEAFWKESYYNSTLSMIRTQAQFEQGAGFYFTESPFWGIKSQLSAHGTWAALRHDTILYVKQVYAERAGDGDFNPTFRTEPLPLPVHYIEPNLPFFEAALTSVSEIRDSGRKYGFIDEEYEKKIGSWITLLNRMMKIALLEYNDEPVDSRDVEWIRTIPQQIVPLVLPPGIDYASYSDNDDFFKGAIVADVFTNAEQGVALEVGTGIPYRILVPLNDGQGRKRIAVGYTFSYYEFLVNQSERMT
ncbi:MAG: DUF3160 domain-containing protein, partial [Spirochaetales bacterium]|nr:DUF3160 domain-containing protein [Spirochaetales bacterium]